VTRFLGERVALVVWDASAYTVFPLSDDYVMMREAIAETRAALDANAASLADPGRERTAGDPADDALGRLLAATGAGDRGASLVGDGLARCVLTFDLADTDRSRSIILATDNGVAGDPLYTLTEAADLAAARGVRLDGLDPGTGYEADELRAVLESRGGLYLAVDDPGAVPTLVEDVLRQRAAELDGSPPIVVTDTPRPVVVVLLAAVGALLVAAWRARE
jgi:Ca-activated chloride channel family protein